MPVYSWLATGPDEVYHAYERQRAGDGRITWSPACGRINGVRSDEIRVEGGRKVCRLCCERLTGARLR